MMTKMKKKLTKKFLIEEYKTKPLYKIVRENKIQFCDLVKLLKKYNIKRKIGYIHGLYSEHLITHCKCGKLKDNRAIQCQECYCKTLKGKTNPMFGKKCPDTKKRMTGKNNPNWIKDRNKVFPKCKDCGVPLKKYSHYRRCSRCAKLGHLNPAFINGKGRKPYPLKFNPQLKDSIRKRDNYQCQNPECNMTEEEHIIVYGQELHVHHIDYNKEHCNKDNLITLCLPCNMRVNYNRNYWKAIFKKIVEVIKNGK
jgi:hypothetical protein